MPGSIETWLQTFMCTQYAHIFEAYGYRSLQAICHLQMPHLLAMGVPRGHCEKILENIHVLRQTMFGRIQKPPESVTDFPHYKYTPRPVNPAAYALKTVAMNANYRGMNQFPEEYSGYGQNASGMQTMGYHQGNYDGANMAMMNHMSGGGSGYGMQGYESAQGHMMVPGQGPVPAHSPMYQSSSQQQAAYLAHQQQQYYASGGSGSGGPASQYSQQYAMQASSGNGGSMQSMNSSAYYSAGGQGAMGQGSPSSKMVPPPHHHLRNTSGQQNPQQVADNILQMASAYPTHHTVQVPLKNRHAPYQIPRSPHYGYTADKGMSQQQQAMGGQPTGSCQQSMNSPSHQQQGMGSSQGAMGQPPSMMYPPTSPHNQPQPRTSPMSPLVMHSPASHQPQSLPSPGSMHSPNSTSAPSPSMRSPCSGPMSTANMPMRSPGHMPSGFSAQQMSSPPHRSLSASEAPGSGQQHCTPTSMQSPASHVGSPYTPGGMSSQMSSPTHQAYSASSSSPYKTEGLRDSGQGPGGQCGGGQKQQGANPLQSLQKLVMLPETQVVDPKSVVSDACLQGAEGGSSSEGSKNSESPAGQSEEAVDCPAGTSDTSSPPATSQASVSGGYTATVASLCDRTGTLVTAPASISEPGTDCSAPQCHNRGVSSSMQSKNRMSLVSSPVTASQSSSQSESSPRASPYASPSTHRSPVVPSASRPDSALSHQVAPTVSLAVTSQANIQTTQSKVHTGTSASSATGTKMPSSNGMLSEKSENASLQKCNGMIDTSCDQVTVQTSCSTVAASDVVSESQTADRPGSVGESSLHNKEFALQTSTAQYTIRTRHSERLAQSQPRTTVSATQGQSNIIKKEPSKHGANKRAVVNGFDSKHINGSANKEELASHGGLHQKSSQQNSVCKVPVVSSASDSVALNKAVVPPKLRSKHPKVSVPAEGACALVTVNGPLQVELSNTGRLEHCDSEQGDTDDEIEKAFEGHSDALSKLCSIFPPQIKSLGDSDSVTFPGSGSDSEDFSFTDGFDLGYDSPPFEMTGADSWKPDVKVTESNTGVDEADAMVVCSQQDSDKGASPKSKGSLGTSNPTKVSPTPGPTRTVTRSSTGSIPKRKTEPDTEFFVKRTRRSSGANDSQSNNHVPLTQCGKAHHKEDVKVVGSEPAESRKEDKARKSGKEEPAGKTSNEGKVKGVTEKLRNSQKSPVVVLTAASVRGRPRKVKADEQTRIWPRGKDGRFIQTGKEPVKELSLPVKQENSDDDDEPLIVVQRRSSKGESSTSDGVRVKTEVPAYTPTENPVEQTASVSTRNAAVGMDSAPNEKLNPSETDRIELKPSPDLPMRGPLDNCSSEIKTSTPCTKSEPFNAQLVTADTSNVSLASVEKSAPGTPVSAASSVAGTPRKRGRPRKGEERSPQKSKNKSSKNKKKKKDLKRQHSEEDSFSTMNLSKTLNLMQNKKKKGDSNQSASGLFSPFVRVQGNKHQPSAVSVFNHAPAEKTDPKSANKKKTVTSSSAPTTSVMITNFSSDKTVMVPSSKTDGSPWVCALCGMRSSYKFLGDLFGPYYLESHLALLNKADTTAKDSKKGSSTTAADVKMTRRRSVGSRNSTESVETPQEVWVHEDCAMWSSGVYLVGSRIYGLEEALRAATATVCACCKEKGAMLGCLHKGCNQNFHYMCAVDKECYLDVENFSMLCPRHKDKRLKSTATPAAKL